MSRRAINDLERDSSSKMDELCHFLDGTVFVRAEECQAVLRPNGANTDVRHGPRADIAPVVRTTKKTAN
jgi:uncharacterized cupin superfamily protein